MIQQVNEDLQWVVMLLDMVQAQYIENTPRHIANPKSSIISILPHVDFNKMKASAIQELLGHRHVIVTSVPGRKYDFNMAGLRTLCSPKKVFHIHG